MENNFEIRVGVKDDIEKEFLINETIKYFDAFEEDCSYEESRDYIIQNTNFDISFVVKNKDNIVGFYLLSDFTSLSSLEDEYTFYDNIENYKNKKGLEGIALLVLKEYRSKGIGKMLINKSIRYCRENNYDYIFGSQLKSLCNLDKWIKTGRKLIAENDEINVTLMNL